MFFANWVIFVVSNGLKWIGPWGCLIFGGFRVDFGASKKLVSSTGSF